MAKAKTEKKVATTINFTMSSQNVRAWQFISLEQLQADLKKARIKSVKVENDSENDPVFVNDRAIKEGEWVVYHSADLCMIMPNKLFKKIMSEEQAEAAQEEATAPAAEAEVTPAADEAPEQLVVLDVQGEPIQVASSIPETEEETDWEIKRVITASSIVDLFNKKSLDKTERNARIEDMMQGISNEKQAIIRNDVNHRLGFRAMMTPSDQRQPKTEKKDRHHGIPRVSVRDGAVRNIVVQERIAFSV